MNCVQSLSTTIPCQLELTLEAGKPTPPTILRELMPTGIMTVNRLTFSHMQKYVTRPLGFWLRHVLEEKSKTNAYLRHPVAANARNVADLEAHPSLENGSCS